jgi:hypothetical protein
MTKHLTLLALAAALAGCASTTAGGGRGGPTEVTRYHLGQPIAPAAIAIEPAMKADANEMEFQTYSDAVAGELARLGFQPAPRDSAPPLIASVSFKRSVIGEVRKRPAFTIGLGGGSFSGGRRGGVGLGGGVSTGIGGGQVRSVYAVEVGVQIRRRSDGTSLWEGRASRQEIAHKPGTDDPSTADVIAAALFKGFPGESGITPTVP